MSEHAAPRAPLSVEEYLKLEEASRIRHEYVGGAIHAHDGGTSRHNVIATSILASLWNAARGGPCRVYGSDMLLRASEEVFYYPDVMVVCGDEETGDEALYQVAPCLVVEVTSPARRGGAVVASEAVGPEGVVPVPCPEVELTLAQIYEGLQEPA